jgi:alanyl aminopeptidase
MLRHGMLRRLPFASTIGAACLAALAACGSAAPRAATPATPPAAAEAPDPAPTGRLPDGASPQRYRLALEVVPDREAFRGTVEIGVRLDRPTRRIWMHGARLRVASATIRTAPDAESGASRTIEARWEPSAERDEVAALRWDEEIGPGDVTVSIEYETNFDRQLRGLYRVDVGSDSYAFTQMEPTSARYAFPSFDEPRWKTPFDVELTVRSEHVAVANTHEIESTDLGGGMRRVRFASTLPLPTYLVALAIGPLDVVEAPPIPPNAVRQHPLPFRGIAARGRGPELAHALRETPALVAALEEYFGTEYPYDKLDVIAVPDFASGAMENAGAITFREPLLLVGPNAPEEQRRGFTAVMAHELAHMWFGDLVTMPWWDDIWLNEAFATWMASKIVARTHPDMRSELGQLAGVHHAMGQDSLEAARRIRQPIDTDHDIRNAFDSITYSKGGGVLAMFEAWIGEDVFRDGVRLYLQRHRFATATSDDLLGALSEVAGRDVGTPFHTFLDQPGVPLVEARLECDASGAALSVSQSRYTPVGSTASRDHVWQIPLCASYPVGRDVRTACELVTTASARVALPGAEGCPAWVMPNAGARGYYRFTLPPEQLQALQGAGWSQLAPLERASVASNLRAAFASAVVPGGEVLGALPALASDPTRTVATEPIGLAHVVIEQIVPPERADAARTWAASLYRTRASRLGWADRAADDGEARLLRRDVLGFLATIARDPAVRREAGRRGRAYLDEGGVHPSAVSPDLAGIAAVVAVQDGDAAFYSLVESRALSTEDAVLRQRLLAALASTEDPALAERALALALDPRLRVNEVLLPLSVQTERAPGRERAWAWTQAHWDELTARIANTRSGAIPWIFSGFCDDARATEVEAFFSSRIEALPGGPRNLRGALEAIHLCAARQRAQQANVVQFLDRR